VRDLDHSDAGLRHLHCSGPKRVRTRGWCLLAFFLFGAAGPALATPAWVVLVRHAEKAASLDSDPELSEAGAVRALALRDALKDFELDEVLTSPFRRTRETAAPLAEARGLRPVVVPVSGDHVAAAVAQIRSMPEGGAVLVVGHSNTLAGIVRGLGGPDLADLRECEYDTLYVLGLDGKPRLIRARYGAASLDCP